jgi:predicted RNase H-like HicB family nuclease
MHYSIVVEEDKLDGGYIAYVPQLQGCFTQANTLDELRTNIREAIEISIEENQTNTSFFGVWDMEVDSATSTNY